MLNVLVVEDEAPIARSLKSIIESAHGSFKVIAHAFNGREALDILAIHQTDIIITDIRMPVMNGLELVKEVRDRYPSIEVILLSGYQEFEYAREAMALGITRYLLKPVTKTQIHTLLESVYSEIMDKKRRMYAEYAASLINRRAATGSADPALYESQLLLLCCAGPMPVYSFFEDIPGKLFWEQCDPQQAVSAELGAAGDLYVLNGKSVSEKWVVLSFYSSIDEERRSPEEWAAAVSERLEDELPVSIVCSEFFSDMTLLGVYAKQMRSVLYKNIIPGIPIRISVQNGHEQYGKPDPASEPLIDRMLSLSAEPQYFESFKSEIKKLIDGWHQTRPSQVYIEQSLSRLLEGAVQAFGTNHLHPSEIPEYIDFVIMHASNYSEISNYMCGIIDSLYLLRNTEKEDEKSSEMLADKIESYVKEYFLEPLDHRTLSEQFGLVPSYLSKIFSRHKGISPAKYIVRLRLEAAKELLLDHPEMLAKDIAFVVGYTDPSYFSRIFKREIGYYPSEFRDKYLGNESHK